jgi:hypothetical protein
MRNIFLSLLLVWLPASALADPVTSASGFFGVTFPCAAPASAAKKTEFMESRDYDCTKGDANYNVHEIVATAKGKEFALKHPEDQVGPFESKYLSTFKKVGWNATSKRGTEKGFKFAIVDATGKGNDHATMMQVHYAMYDSNDASITFSVKGFAAHAKEMDDAIASFKILK